MLARTHPPSHCADRSAAAVPRRRRPPLGDDNNNRYLPYATLYLGDGVTRRARVLAGLNPMDPQNLLFTRQRVEGTAAFPGIGMGSTLVPIAPDTYPPGATFDASTWHNAYTYAFAPLKPDYTVSQGVIAPSSAEQTALALLTAKRGYRRLEEVPPQEQAAMLTQVRASLAAEARERAQADAASPAEAAALDYPELRESWRAAARVEAEGGAALLAAEEAERRARAARMGGGGNGA